MGADTGQSWPLIKLLGPVKVNSEAGLDVTPTSNKTSHLLALVASNVNQPVSVERCIGELWSEAAPASPISTLQTYVLNLRGTLAKVGPSCHLASLNSAYMLEVDDPAAVIDLSRFLHVSSAPGSSSPLEALALWRGLAFADLRIGETLTPVAHRADALRREQLARAYEDLVRARWSPTSEQMKLMYRTCDFWTDERLLSGFAICLGRSPSLAAEWHEQLSSWRAYLEGELAAELGATLGAVTTAILSHIDALELEEARATWIRHYANPRQE